MNRPEVRIVSQQSEEIKPANISKSEEEALLAKYGYGSAPNSFSSFKEEPVIESNPLTFEEMVMREEQKKRDEEMRRKHNQHGPKPITFDGEYRTETTYGETDGITFKINVVTNIK
jgi:hypothetical protein